MKPSFRLLFRIHSLKRASSEKSSAKISLAQFKASVAVSTSFSGEINFSASASGLAQGRRRAFASSSSPFSLAIMPLVLRFGLQGRYRSSRRTAVSAARISFFNSSVNFPCSKILWRILSLRSSSFRRYCSFSSRFRSSSSFKPEVSSLRQRAIKGTVFPSSKSCTAASTCFFFKDKSSLIF